MIVADVASQPETAPAPAPAPAGAVTLPGGWAMWPVLVLRTAGLSAERILALAGREQDAWFLPAAERAAALAEVATDPWLLEALTWQNPSIPRTWLTKHAARLRLGEDRLTRRSYREAMLVRYLQRYCTKNDTVGFFGPISWGLIDPQLPTGVDPGVDRGLAGRWVYFEWWAIETLAQRFSELPQVRRWLAPRPDPTSALQGTRLVRMQMRDERLAPTHAAVFAECDGRRTPEQILAALGPRAPELGVASLEDLLAVLEDLTQRDRILWSLELPWAVDQTQPLRELLMEIGDRPLRTRLLGMLDDLCAARDAVAAAAGDAEALDAALSELERRFTEITARPAARQKTDPASFGSASPEPEDSPQPALIGRGLVWEDTLSHRRITLHPDVVGECAPTLTLVLEAARWFTWAIGNEIFQAARERIAAAADRSLPLRRLWLSVFPELAPDPATALGRTQAELQRRSSSLLLDPASDGSVPGAAPPGRFLESETLRERWSETFACPGPGWSGARRHCPDLMIDAPDAAAIDVGHYRWVLGETHVAVNTVEQRALEQHCPWPGWMEAQIAEEVSGPRYVFAPPRDWPNIGPRRWPPVNLKLPSDIFWSTAPRDALDPGVRRLQSGELDVRLQDDGQLIVTSRSDGSLRVPLLEFLGEALSCGIAQQFKLLPGRRSLPRITVGRTVVQRACRTVAVSDLPLDARPDGAEQHLVAALLALEVPRMSFVTIPGEAKPVFCDLRNELLINGLLRMLRRVEPGISITFSEMLPDFGGLWLRDADGAPHTCELRVSVFDPLPPAIYR
jgi:hypothetical protein